MKRFSISIFLLFVFSGWVSAQQGNTFGFVAQGGTLVFPATHNHSSSFSYKDNYIGKAGKSVALGVYNQYSFGRHFGISGAILCRYSITDYKKTYQFHAVNNGITSGSIRREAGEMTEYFLQMPVKLHYSFGKAARFGVTVGSGFTRQLGLKGVFQNSFVDLSNPTSVETFTSESQNIGFVEFSTYLSWSGGVFYKLNANTSVGLEFIFENRSKIEDEEYFKRCLLCDEYYLTYGPDVRSFVLSIRQNILEEN